MTLRKSNTILETSSNCINGAICPFKVFFFIEKTTCMGKNCLKLPDLVEMKRWNKLLVM